ncbi:MAG: DUF4349 domain-containing protein [Spirochaetes bacterium]|nr:DUF4349 domain-containing protein [Spirochaetota bacterium]
MKSFLVIANLIILLMFPKTSRSDDVHTAFSYVYHLSVHNSEFATKRIRDFVPTRKGYVSFFSNSRINVRIPHVAIESFKQLLAELGYIVGENQKREDLAFTMITLNTRLSSKQKLLNDLEQISATHLGETLQIEKEINKVILEIEEIKGKILYYSDRIAMSEVTVFLASSHISNKQIGYDVPAQWILNLGIEKLMTER